jgi:beta propeller repeat protein
VFAVGSNVDQTQLNSDPGEQATPDIFDEIVVWADDRKENWDIYFYDLDSEFELPLTYNDADQDQPRVYRNYVVWRDNRNGNYDIYMYDMTRGTETQITSDPHDQSAPAIFGTWVIWQDKRNGNYDLYVYDILSGSEYQLTTESSNQKSPSIFANSVVYLDDKDGDYEIYMGFLPTSMPPEHPDLNNTSDIDIDLFGGGVPALVDPTKITADSVDQDPPVMWGNYIVWSDTRKGNNDVYLHNLMSREEVQLTTNPSDQKNPRVYGNTVLWEDYRNINIDIYQYDVITKAAKNIADTDGNEYSPAIYNNKIVWISDKRGDGDVLYYTFNINAPHPDDMPGYFDTVKPTAEEANSPSYRLAFGSIAVVVILLVVRYIVLRKNAVEEEVPVPTLREITKLKTKQELINMCEELGLNPQGNKKRLRKRLVNYIKAKEREKFARVAKLAQEQDLYDGSPLDGMEDSFDEEWGISPNFDFETVDLEWDSGLESTGIIGDAEKRMLGIGY